MRASAATALFLISQHGWSMKLQVEGHADLTLPPQIAISSSSSPNMKSIRLESHSGGASSEVSSSAEAESSAPESNTISIYSVSESHSESSSSSESVESVNKHLVSRSMELPDFTFGNLIPRAATKTKSSAPDKTSPKKEGSQGSKSKQANSKKGGSQQSNTKKGGAKQADPKKSGSKQGANSKKAESKQGNSKKGGLSKTTSKNGNPKNQNKLPFGNLRTGRIGMSIPKSSMRTPNPISTFTPSNFNVNSYYNGRTPSPVPIMAPVKRSLEPDLDVEDMYKFVLLKRALVRLIERNELERREEPWEDEFEAHNFRRCAEDEHGDEWETIGC